MGSNPPGNTPPPKPWERAGTSSGPAPFKPPSSGSTSNVVEASGTAKPGEIVTTANRIAPANTNTIGRPLPSRPWEQNYGSTYGGYGSNVNYNSGYGSGMYSSVGGFGGGYGGGLYGNNMYRGGGYGGMYGGSGMIGGGGMYNNGFGGQMGGGYGMGGMAGPYGNQDPNNPHGPPQSPQGFWMSFFQVLHTFVNAFGNFTMLLSQNTQSMHIFFSAMLQLVDSSGMTYSALVRYILPLLGIRSKPRKQQLGPGEALGQNGVPGSNGQGPLLLEGPKAPTGSWDNVWRDDARGTR